MAQAAFANAENARSAGVRKSRVPPLALALCCATNAPVFGASDDATLVATARYPFLLLAAAAVLLLLVIGMAILERYASVIRETERMNAEIERRVAEKTREIEANYARVQEVLREQALARERQRILADMHDGLGASLIGLLRHVQSGRADRAGIEHRVREALQEMRVAIDALQPHEGDLAAVLGSLRYRLDDMIRATGVHLAWEVDELPEIEDLKPSAVFSLQRILLEAITNALKHSGARHLRFEARARDDAEVEIRLEDDGCGFDPSQPAAGVGLANMRARAGRVGAQLVIASHAGQGTMVRLLLPCALPRVTEESAPERSDPRTLQGLVPAPGLA